jgi:hypothetical protein
MKPLFHYSLFNDPRIVTKRREIWKWFIVRKNPDVRPPTSSVTDSIIVMLCRRTHTLASYFHVTNELPICVECDTPFTLEHILVDCIEITMSRSKYFSVSSLEEQFDTVQMRDLTNA